MLSKAQLTTHSRLSPGQAHRNYDWFATDWVPRSQWSLIWPKHMHPPPDPPRRARTGWFLDPAPTPGSDRGLYHGLPSKPPPRAHEPCTPVTWVTRVLPPLPESTCQWGWVPPLPPGRLSVRRNHSCLHRGRAWTHMLTQAPSWGCGQGKAVFEHTLPC